MCYSKLWKKRVHTKRGCSRLSKLIQWCDSTGPATISQQKFSIQFAIFDRFLHIFRWKDSRVHINELGQKRLLLSVPVPERRYARETMPGENWSKNILLDAATHRLTCTKQNRREMQHKHKLGGRTWPPVSPSYCFHLVYQSFIKRIDASGAEKRPQ